jgi:O-antigen biosynthesis protein
MSNQLYGNKDENYYKLVRSETIELIPKTAKRILDIGCGNGDTALAAKNLLNAEFVAGVELFEKAALEAKEKLDLVIQDDIEKIEFPFDDGTFDCIICADILEHLSNPWDTLNKLSRLLAPNAVLIASIPNLQYIVPLLKIAFNKFEYEQAGILDKTHLRFFTLHTIKKMFDECNYDIVKIGANMNNTIKFKILNAITFGLTTPYSVFQYLISAVKRQ